MMKKIVYTLVLIALLSVHFSCTQQQVARNWGGTASVDIKEKLVMVTWKNTELWILTRQPTSADVPETYKFQESASWGVLEGTVVIKEKFTPPKK